MSAREADRTAERAESEPTGPEESEPSILVALDLSPESLAAAELAAEWAAALGVSIEGIFVEDRELFDFADHPLAWQVDLFGKVTRPIDRAQVERSLRAQAGRARRLMARAARPQRVAWTLRVVRGSVFDEIRLASRRGGRGGVVSIGRTGWSRRRLGRMAQRLLAEQSLRILMPGRRAARAGPVTAIYGEAVGGGNGDEALATAKRLARATRRPLAVRILAGNASEAARLRARAAAGLAEEDADVGPEKVRFETVPFEPLERRAPADLAAALSSLGSCSLLVLPAGIFASAENLCGLVSALDCPVLLVR